MQINKEFLKSLNPCANRYENYLEHNADFSGSFSDFLELPNVAYSDKSWVAEKILNKNQAVKWAILCAQSVIHVFEAKNTDDKILSNCINFLKTVNDFDNLTDTEKLEIKKHLDIIRDYYTAQYATDALYTVYATNAVYAVCAAAHAAHYTIRATRFAASATIAATYAARSAKNAGEDADAAQQNQEALNLQFLKQVTSL